MRPRHAVVIAAFGFAPFVIGASAAHAAEPVLDVGDSVVVIDPTVDADAEWWNDPDAGDPKMTYERAMLTGVRVDRYDTAADCKASARILNAQRQVDRLSGRYHCHGRTMHYVA